MVFSTNINTEMLFEVNLKQLLTSIKIHFSNMCAEGGGDCGHKGMSGVRRWSLVGVRCVKTACGPRMRMSERSASVKQCVSVHAN